MPEWIGSPLRRNEMSALPPPTSTQHRVARGQGLVAAQPLAHRQVGEAVLLGAVDDLDVDAGAQPHAVEEGLAVLGLAHGARGHGAIAHDAVACP